LAIFAIVARLQPVALHRQCRYAVHLIRPFETPNRTICPPERTALQ
jgi:hypothetical protein